MFGIILSGIASALRELSDTIGKKEMHDGVVGHFTFGFLSMFFGALFLFGYGIYFDDFVFSLASLPTFLPRVALEILQTYVMVLAVARADRSDFGLVRVLTIPLLLSVDMWLGYVVSPLQYAGVGLILAAVGYLVISEGVRKRGKWLLLVGAVNAVATISLFKYNITHFNSVAAEESIIMTILLIVFFAGAWHYGRENPFTFLRRPVFALQSGASGLSSAVGSFAFLFAPAGVIVAALRGSAILFALVSGKMYFRERHFRIKLILFFVILAGLVLLAIGS